MKRTAAFLTALIITLMMGMVYIGTAEASVPGQHCLKNPVNGYFRCYPTHQDLLNAVAAKSDQHIIGQNYQNANYGGAELVWYVNGTCDVFTAYDAASLPSGWDNVTSSLKVFPSSGCGYTQTFTSTLFGGTMRLYRVNTPQVSPNDAISSEAWENTP